MNRPLRYTVMSVPLMSRCGGFLLLTHVNTRSRWLICAALLLGLLNISVGTLPVRAQTPTPVHKSWIQRHPTLTAIGAGLATHHALKVAARNAKEHGKKLNWAERHPTLSAIGVGVVVHHVIKKTTPTQ
jgi:hypothetical protein